MKAAGMDSIPNLRPHGRVCAEYVRRAGVLPLFWAGSGVELCFNGGELHLVLEADFRRLEPWIAPDGVRFRQEPTAKGMALAEDAALAFLRQLRRCNPRSKLVWAYGMLGDALRPALEGAVERFRREDPWGYYLPLPHVTGETMGSRQHPGPLCHQAAAERTAELLRKILP